LGFCRSIRSALTEPAPIPLAYWRTRPRLKPSETMSFGVADEARSAWWGTIRASSSKALESNCRQRSSGRHGHPRTPAPLSRILPPVADPAQFDSALAPKAVRPLWGRAAVLLVCFSTEAGGVSAGSENTPASREKQRGGGAFTEEKDTWNRTT
jgi:hypothetical protein